MPDAPILTTPCSFFVFRTPLLPWEVIAHFSTHLLAPRAPAEAGELEQALARDYAMLCERLRNCVGDPIIREALFVASPSLDEAIDAWLADPNQPRAHGVADILIRYLGRMAARPTPFGLFSGCSTGTIGTKTSLALAPRASYRRHTRLDMHYLSALTEALGQEPALRAALPVRPSTGLYPAAGQLRYAEARTDAKSRTLSYHLVSVERTDYLDATLRRAEAGRRPAELADALVESFPDIARDEADAYVETLIDSQILRSDLTPTVTGGEPLDDILATLGTVSEGEEAARVLAAAGESLRMIDADGLGIASLRYRAVAETLAKLPAKPDIARLFQVDLYKPAVAAELGGAVLDELQRAVGLLARIAVPSTNHSLRRFREAFTERYGERLGGPLAHGSTVPLVEVLDDEAGIGFSSSLGGSSEPSPLLADLEFPSNAEPPGAPFGPREAHLLRRLDETVRARASTLSLDEHDLERLSSTQPARLPGAFALWATLAAGSADALERGDFRLFIQGLSGPSGAVLLGRFCHGDPSLRAAVQAHLAEEEAARPDAIFAEIVHLPEGRLGNILCRPVLRKYEIPYLGRSGAPEAQQIPITDLRVGLSNGRIALVSARHGREVIPRLTSAHNHRAATLGIYRFLCALQYEQERRIGWSWGVLEAAPFLPRVQSGRLVLSLARWNLFKDQLEALGKAKATRGERYRSVQRLRAELALPRWVGLADADNILPVDLDNVLSVDSFVQLVKARDTATLVELFEEENLLAQGPEGRFFHELVVPFIAKQPPSSATQTTAVTRSTVPRTFLPGSEWLYAKLYTGTATADAVLQAVVAPVVEAARACQIARGWFFIRYGDPHWHVRLRIRGDARELVSTTLPALRQAAEPLLQDGRLWKLVLEPYEREVVRYGGPDGIDLAETIFEADSDAVLSIVQLLEGDAGADARWRLALRGIHLLLLDLGLDLAQRTFVMRRCRANFGAEHHVNAAFEKRLGAKFRSERQALEELIATPVGTEHPLDPGFELFARRSEQLSAAVEQLRDREREGRLDVPIQELAMSFIHMHANRLLRSEQRAQELVLYDFLLRLYESEAARALKRSRA